MSLVGACSVDNPGVAPPNHAINFPIALALSPGDRPDFLYIANSNFDLRYNAGSVQSYDLSAIETELPDACRDNPCKLEDPERFLAPNGEVLIGSHAAAMDVSPDGHRLYLAVRSDTNLTYIDVGADGGLSCGGSGNRPRCDDDHRRGDEAIATDRGISLPSDPVGIAVGSLSDYGHPGDGDLVLMAHRSGRVSLFLEQLEGAGTAPTLIHVVSGLPEGLVSLELDPRGFAWAPSADIAQIGRVGVAIDAETRDLGDSFLFDLGTLAVTDIDTGGRGDARDVAFDPRPGKELAYVLSRRPEAVLVADRANAEPGELGVIDEIAIGFGPSRIAAAEIDFAAEGDPADPRLLLFVSCFDSREIWVVDADRRAVLNVIRRMSGPFELAVDAARKRVYVVDFRASVVRVASLEPMIECFQMGVPTGDTGCEPRVIGWLGVERPVGDLL